MIDLRINGADASADDAEAGTTLLDYLHETRRLTGTKLACGIAVCRACTVAVRRHPGALLQTALACSTTLETLRGTEILTIEGVAPSANALHPVQIAFLDAFAFQCGYCTPGFTMAALVLLDRLRLSPVAAADVPAAIEDVIGDHVCRCTGYAGYHQALEGLIFSVAGLTR
jgi:aerobic-type carbon monoxide dehydrogenase small subunit (CoxS/CutS family)